MINAVLTKFAGLRELKDPIKWVSPFSWLIVLFTSFGTLFAFFRPSLFEFLATFVVDALAGIANSFIEPIIFKRFYPQYAGIVPRLNRNTFESQSPAELRESLNAFSTFPLHRARFGYLASFIKVLPGTAVIVFFWKHPDRSNVVQFFQVLALAAVYVWYFAAAVYFENHTLLSKFVRQNWDLFRSAARSRIAQTWDHGFSRLELAAVSVCLVFTLFLQWMIAPRQSYFTANTANLILGSMGVALVAAIYMMSRSYMDSRLNALIEAMKKTDNSEAFPQIPEDTLWQLKALESTYNDLGTRLKRQEKELRRAVFNESERARMMSVGERTALMVHDLASPLNAALYCIEEAAASTNTLAKTEYANQVSANIRRALELVTNVRQRLKATDQRGGYDSSLGRSTAIAIKYLRNEFPATLTTRTSFVVDPLVTQLAVNMPEVELIQVFENLGSNALKDFVAHQNEEPRIMIELVYSDEQTAMITFSDNGSGLDPATFKDIIDRDGASYGFGLRLCYRLLLSYGGNLELVPQAPGLGTKLMISLQQSRTNATHQTTVSP